MSVATLSETRNYGRRLTYFKDLRLPGIRNVAYDFSPLMSMFLGKLTNADFMQRPMSGRAMETGGGTSVEVYHRLGKNDTVKPIASEWGTVTTTPQDNVRFSRANWAMYNGAVTVSFTEMKMNANSPERIASLVDDEVTDLVNSLADTIAADLYDNGGDASRVTDLGSIISANDSVQGLSGATYPRWNSRGVSARGTAAGSVSFASGSFATQGIADMRTAWLNVMEGAIVPQAILTTHAVYGMYEGQLQPQQEFRSMDAANAGFQSLAFKTAPIFADSKCPIGEMYFLRFGTNGLRLIVLEGCNFEVMDFHEAESQEAWSAKGIFKGQLVTDNRLALNKLTGITA